MVRYARQFFIGHYDPYGNHFFAYGLKDGVAQWLGPKPITYQQREPDSVEFTGYFPEAR